ncbi:hypothetical protein I8748_19500 [Nostoc sp. CENA67]|uniref:Uncharacterized protein n=1 Tax=Amazonocrinis nigriterrae CENA67 TaxID=2794033 RepID=A0A8J7HUD6_9NOST|nr:hypothetical protein [Amazonocrinis nigriterrae]MBH8564345.1 hypothetical protein [Amazonocrinis nigriterrae CENA67]
MNLELFNRIPVTSLLLLWLTYGLLGWYLAAHEIIWLVGAFVAVVAIAVVRKSVSWLQQLLVFSSKTLVVILVVSASIALIASWSLLLSLFLIPVATTCLADLEMRFTGFKRLETFWILTSLAASGLIVGEIIDLLLFPSGGYY